MGWPFHSTPEHIAVRTWVKQHSGSWTERDAKKFAQWLEAAPEHRIVYNKVVAACECAKQVQMEPPQQTWSVRPSLFSHWRTVGVALIVCAVFIPGWKRFNDWWNGTPVTWTAQSNAPRTVTLTDGTRIELDAGTQVITQWGARARHATLVHGEALFSVSHNSVRPLTVDVGRGHLTDLGTVFDVEALAHSVRVSVLEGSVGVRTRHGEAILTAGHGGGYEGTGELLPITRVDSSVTSWREGVRRFDATALTDVLDMLSRRHGVQLTIADDAAARLRLSGTLRMDDLPLSLRTLGTALQLEVRWIDEHHVELSSRGGD
ncbi:MAG: FecR domain-containing protein [Proteobacteria bacterium]|nr:FecR domain-containing protein [Pseudomonadota bacterium]